MVRKELHREVDRIVDKLVSSSEISSELIYLYELQDAIMETVKKEKECTYAKTLR